MKKISKILGIIACAFVIMFSGALLTACGQNAFDIKGVTLKGTAECKIVWGPNASQEDKEELWGEVGATNDEEFAQMYSEMGGEFYETWTCVFNQDGSVVVTLTEHDEPETITWHYVQSQDLKTIQTYTDAELTDIFLPFEFIEGKYWLNIAPDAEYDVSIYFAFARA